MLISNLDKIENFLKTQEYTSAARECFFSIEGRLRDILVNETEKLDEQTQQRVRTKEQEFAKSGRGKSFEDFTLGQLIAVVRDAKFFEAWEKVSQRKFPHLIDLNRLSKLRNELVHEDRNNPPQVSQYEAETLFAFLKELYDHFGVDEFQSEPQPFPKILPKSLETPVETMETFSLGQLCVRRNEGHVWFMLTFAAAYLLPVIIDLFIWFTSSRSQQLFLIESELLIFLMAITRAIVIDNFVFETKSPSGWLERSLYSELPNTIIVFCVLIYIVGYFRFDNIFVITLMIISEFLVFAMVVCYVVFIKHRQFKDVQACQSTVTQPLRG
jgi:hypothetical protein